MIEINKNYNENCLDTMAKMPDNFIDLTVTSPPYDNLRTYKGYSFDFENSYVITGNSKIIKLLERQLLVDYSKYKYSFLIFS